MAHRNMPCVIDRQDLFDYLDKSPRYRHILSEVALTKDEYSIEEVAAILGIKEPWRLRRRIRNGCLVGRVPKSALLRVRKADSAEIAMQLGYGEETVKKIWAAESDMEIDRILAFARNSEKRYRIGSAAK